MKEKTYKKVDNLIWMMKEVWKADKVFVLKVFAAVPIMAVLPLVESYFVKVLLDSLGMGADFGKLAVICVVFISILALLEIGKSLIENAQQEHQYYPTGKFQNRMSMAEYETDFENTESQHYQEISGYAWTDASCGNSAVEWGCKDVAGSLTYLLGIVGYGSLLSVVNPVIFLIVAAVSVLSYFSGRWYSHYFEKHKKEWEKEERKKQYLEQLSFDFQAAKDIKLYGMEDWLNRLAKDYQTYLFLWKKRCSLRTVYASILAGLMTLLQDGATYFFLITLLFRGEIGVGDFVFYFGVVSSIATFLSGLIANLAVLHNRAEKISYYRMLFDYTNQFNHGVGIPVPREGIEIEFRDVRYRYQGASEDTLKGVNLKIQAGESIALVGQNGAGKTTLVKLLCGMYRPTEGEILINGKAIEEYNIFQYYSMISAVFQEIKLVAFTIFQFVASGDLERKNAREEVIRALKQAGLWEKIESLPGGIDTHLMKGIYEDGIDLSGGETQKLLLARAIYQNGAILVLDEPTAALDPIAENNLYLEYWKITEGKTSVYISHRFASTRFCDRIVLLENGRITESGSHEELMEKNGSYAYMFGVQSKYYKEGEIHGEE